MALGWRTLQAMPRLRCYADAERREAETKPIRGRTPEVKPLGRRNQSWWNIKREENGDICINAGYNAPLLRYRPDDTLLIYDFGYWNKASYNDAIFEVTGIQTETRDGKMWALIDGSKYLIRPNPKRVWEHGKGWLPYSEPLPENIFKRVEKYAQGHVQAHGYSTWTYTNPPNRIVHHIKRKAMREVRERYAKFVAYATALDSIREKHPEPKEYEEPFGVTFEHIGDTIYYSWYNPQMPVAPHSKDFAHDHAAELCTLMLSEDAMDNYKAYLWLSVKRDWRSHSVTTAHFAERVIIMHHHAEVLTEREVTAGKATKDRYAWAIPEGGQTA
jgi:hypothetical protein